MKNTMIIVSAGSLALCLILCWAFDSLQAASKAEAHRAEAEVSQIQ